VRTLASTPFDFPTIASADIDSVATVASAIRAVDKGMRTISSGKTWQRQVLSTGEGELLIMPAVSQSLFGVKLVSVAPDDAAAMTPRIQGVYALFDQETHGIVAVYNASNLTAIRTAAFSGWVTQQVSPPAARRLLVFGTGPQARAHVEAMRAVRPIDEIRIVGRSPGSAARLVDELAADGIVATVGTPSDSAWAEIICCCTSSAEPVVFGTELSPGVHINAVGSHHANRRELDGATMHRARVVVETRDSALAEAGDVVMAIDEGLMTRDDMDLDLEELSRNVSPEHDPRKDITVYKSVGVGYQDLLIAEYVASALRQRAGQGNDPATNSHR